jgi:type VI secretion system protein ImpA
MQPIDVDALLAPLADDKPCGDDLEYDPAFLALEAAARAKPEQQFGDTIIPAQDPDWRVMQEQALALFERTRDLRVGVMLLRAATRLHGLPGFAAAARLLHGLLERHWDHVHPQLDASDNLDATMRLNALAPLADAAAVLGDLRSASIGPARGGLTVRQIELALGKAEPSEGESVASADGVAQAVAAGSAASPTLAADLVGAHDAVRGIEAVVDAKAGAANAPDLRPLRVLTQCLAQVAQQGQPQAEAANGSDGEALAPGDVAGIAVAAGSLRTRDDAIRALDRVCEWITRNEPTNPAPLLIRRAQRLMTKNFLDIIRDLAPDGLKDVERIAGVDGS